MKETTFIKQNKKKWARFEKLSGRKNNDPDEVSKLFTEITEDLSYARTFYPRRSVRVYLNQLSQGVFTSLYKQRKQPLGNLTTFWTESVPIEMYRARYNLLTAFLFFALAVVIGAVSQHYDHDFVKLILGDGYVWETEQRIERGDPMGVYGEMPQTGMFLMITVNNIRVAFMAFALGIFATLGTYVLLLRNGIMLGSFQWWFYTKGLFMTSFLAVWIHGAFEISAIIIAGAAGITLGNGLLFPRSFTRVQSLVFSAKRGLTILLSLIPFFIIAGFLESFVTRYYNVLPAIVKWLIILLSFAIIIFYYVVYPFYVAKRKPHKLELKEVPRYIPDRKIEKYKIRKTAEVFTETFYLFIKSAGVISRIFFTIIFPLSLLLLYGIFAQDRSNFQYNLSMFETMRAVFGTGMDFTWLKFGGWSFITALLICNVYYVTNFLDKKAVFAGYFKFVLRHGLWILMFTTVIYLLLSQAPYAIILLGMFLAPFLTMIPAIIVHEKKDFFTAFGNSFNLGKGAYGDSLGAFAIFLLIFFIFKFALENPIGGFGDFDVISLIDEILREILITVYDNYQVAINAVNSIIYMLFFFMIMTVYTLSFSFSYFSSSETKTAKGLYNRLEKFGKRNKQFETEVDYD